MSNQTQRAVMGCDQIGLVAVEAGRLLVLQIERGRVREACLTSEEQVLTSLSWWRTVPVLLDETTAHLAERLSAEGFRMSVQMSA